MITISEILGQRIKYYRKKKKLSQEKLSELADLHPTYIGQLERGEKNASIESLYKISIGLQVPITQLLEKLDEYNPEGYDVVETTNSTNNNIPLGNDVKFCVEFVMTVCLPYEKMKNFQNLSINVQKMTIYFLNWGG